MYVIYNAPSSGGRGVYAKPLVFAASFSLRGNGAPDMSFLKPPRPSSKTPRFCDAIFDAQGRWFRGLRVKPPTHTVENETPKNEGLAGRTLRHVAHVLPGCSEVTPFCAPRVLRDDPRVLPGCSEMTFGMSRVCSRDVRMWYQRSSEFHVYVVSSRHRAGYLG